MSPTFDPITFLGITDLSGEEKKIVSDKLLNKMYQYLLIRTVEELDVPQLKKTKTPNELLSIAKSKIPNFSIKCKQYLEDFRIEFNKNLNTL